ncbi:MAG: hypothetical protein KF749_09450 [Bacteroidetes bacterium]|nr:hypothetical protein [Bacteroidota bacterium]MCW5894850.1 hypothetical protein [Bacteroidota bacterium]
MSNYEYRPSESAVSPRRLPVPSLFDTIDMFELDQCCAYGDHKPRRGISRSSACGMLVALAMLFCFTSQAVYPQSTEDSTAQLESYKRQIKRLYSEVEKVQREDFYFTKLRAWWIENPELEDSIRSKYLQTMGSDQFLREKDPFYVVATPPPHNDLIVLFSGINIVKGAELREFLYKKRENQDLRRQIIESPGRRAELLDSVQIASVSAPRIFNGADTTIKYFNRYAIEGIDHSASTVFSARFPERLNCKIDDKWGIEFKLGNEEMNYPFWYSGNSSILILYKRIKLGGQIPLWLGSPDNRLTGKLWTPRGLDGGFGMHGEFDFAFAGGALLVGARRSDVNGTFAQLPNIYRISVMAQAWYSFTITIKNSADLVRVKVGGGYHQIARDIMTYSASGDRSKILPSGESDRPFWSPYISCDIMDQRSDDRFGGSFQYYHEWLMTTIWLELLPNHIRIELKGGLPILRSRYPWEPTHFVTMNVPITFAF